MLCEKVICCDNFVYNKLHYTLNNEIFLLWPLFFQQQTLKDCTCYSNHLFTYTI